MIKKDPELCDAVLEVCGDLGKDFDELRRQAAERRGPLGVEWLAMMHPDNVQELERIDSPSDGNWLWVPAFVAKAVRSMADLASVETKSGWNIYEVHGLLTFKTGEAAATGCRILESEAASDLERFPYIEVVGPVGKGKVFKRDISALC